MLSSKLILIKIGGSAITDKKTPYKIKDASLKRIAKEISKVKSIPMIISHGSGSFGHTSASIYGGKKGYKNKLGIAKVSKDAFDINKIVVDALISEDVPAISIRPMGILTASGGKPNKLFLESIEEMISQKLIPVIFGDVIWDKKWKSTIFSGEKTLNFLAENLVKKGYKIDRIIQIGETGGVYDDKKKIVPLINKKNWVKVKKYIGETEGADVTGGMVHKVESALILARKGIKTLLIGSEKNSLYSAIIGGSTKGTTIA